MLITLALLSAPLGVAPIVTGLTVAVLPTGWLAAFHRLGNDDSLQSRLVGQTWGKEQSVKVHSKLLLPWLQNRLRRRRRRPV